MSVPDREAFAGGFHEGMGRAAALAALGRRFMQRDPGEARSAARVLFTGVLRLALVQVISDPDAPLDAEELERLDAAARRYLAGETPARILGEREFWGLSFQLGPETLEPRPDTETLVQVALDQLECAGLRDGRALRILDFGVGSGCVLTALLVELPQAFGVGVDLAPGAAMIAATNAARNGVAKRSAFLVSDWGAPLGATGEGSFDLVTSNPPYVESWSLRGLPPAVRLNDPALALDGGTDGLEPYRALAPAALRLLRPGGVAAFEVGSGQAATVAGLLRLAGFRDVAVKEDLGGVMRVVSGLRQMGHPEGSQFLLGVGPRKG